MANSYSYMNEDEIDDELKCAVCKQPFHEPVSSKECHHTFCKGCIIACINHERRCPVCRTDSNHEYYQPVGSRALLNQLNRLRVRCNACQARNIQRSDFQQHTQNCPNWVIPCTAADIRCAWRGMRNQFANHMRNCPFQRIRPIVDDLHGQINNLQGQIQSHSQQINDLQGQVQSQSTRINQLQELLQWLSFFFVFFLIVHVLVLSKSEQNTQPRSFREKFRGLFEN